MKLNRVARETYLPIVRVGSAQIAEGLACTECVSGCGTPLYD